MKKKILAGVLGVSLLVGTIACNTKPQSGNGNSENSTESATESVETAPTIKIVPKKSNYLFVLDGTETPAEIPVTVYSDGNVVDSPSLTFTSLNEEVCEVSGNVVTPKGVGRTEVEITYGEKSSRVSVSVSEKTTKELVNTFDEKYVNTYGRTFLKNDKLCLDHVSTGLDVAIKGTYLDVTIEGTGSNYLCVFIDGEKEYSSRILIKGGTKTYTIAEGLKDGFHTIRMVKSSEIDDGQMKIVNVLADEFYTAPEKSPLYIEFIGDSITAGYGALGKAGDVRTVENSDGCSSFAYKTAQILDADYSVIAKQGICVKAHYWLTESMAEIYKYTSTKTREEYSFERRPDIVVLNLGTNDAGYISSTNYDYSEDFPNDYLDFLKTIRKNYPDAYIICAYGFMGSTSIVNNGINLAIEQMQDEKVFRAGGFYPANNMGANGHPSSLAQSDWAESLAEFISKDVLKR